METLLNPDTGLIIWTIVSFACLVLLLGKVAWKPLLQALQEREDGIRKAIADAASSRQTADQLKAQYEQELARGQEKVDAMLKQAQAEGQRLREQMLKETEAEARRLTEQTKRQLEEEKAKLSRELRQEVAGLSVRLTEKLLRHSVNAKEQENLVAGFMKDLDKEPKAN
jgi:F-type H+-transporting ATPase subunit b